MQVFLPLIIISAIILLGFLGNLIFKKTSVPNVIWLLLFGLLLGPVFHVMDIGLFRGVSEFVAALAIIIILFEGGIYMDLYKLFKEAPRGVLLGISTFALSVIATAVLMFLAGQTLLNGILLGAIIGGTSSPIVIPIVSKLRGLKEDTRIILSIESAITDVLCIVIAITVMNAILIGTADVSMAAHSIVSAFSIGALIGLLIGLIWIPVMKKLEAEEFSYVVTLGLLFLIYAGVELLQGSGAIACLVFGIVLANGRKIFSMIKYEHLAYEISAHTKQFHSLIAFFIRTFFFVYLGLLVTVSNIWLILSGLCLSVILLGVRFAAVKTAMWKARVEKRDEKIMSIMMPRGLAAAVLAYLPIARGVPNTGDFVDIVFTVILASVIICTIGIFLTEKEKPKEKEKKPKAAA